MSKEVKRYEAMLLEDSPRLQNILPQGAILCGKEPVAVYLASDYEALLAENARLESAWHVDTLKRKDALIEMQEKESDRVKAELAALLAERDRMAKALRKIQDAQCKSSPTATDFGISWDRGMLIGTMKDIARAALQGEQP